MLITLSQVGLYFILFAFAAGMTYFLIHNARHFGLIDVPNERSSHSTPKPRGGGIAFVAAFFLGVTVLYQMGILDRHWVLPLLVGGPLVAIVGLMDDRRSVPAMIRLLIHFMAASVTYIVVTLGFSIPVEISFLPTNSPFLTMLFCIFFIAWMINLYNFMDGIDGLAATQGVVVAASSAILCFWQASMPLFALYMALSASIAGFLLFNFAPAKIFMGDSGAYFLGFAFATLALMTKLFAHLSLIAHLILLGVFIADATCTLIIRMLRRKKFYQAHRDHGFQHAVQMGWSHRRVCVFYNLITVFWLAPLAICSVIYHQFSMMFLFIAYTPIMFLLYFFKAGLEAERCELSQAKAGH